MLGRQTAQGASAGEAPAGEGVGALGGGLTLEDVGDGQLGAAGNGGVGFQGEGEAGAREEDVGVWVAGMVYALVGLERLVWRASQRPRDR